MLVACPLNLCGPLRLTINLWIKKNGAHHPLHPDGLLETLPKVCRNLGSLFDTIEIGTPCNRTISHIYNRQNSSSVKVIHTARKCPDLVSWFTITHTVSCLRYVCGKWVTKSIVTCSHFYYATSKGWSSPAGFWCLSFTC